MLKYICFFILIIFALFGLCEALHSLKLKLILGKGKINSKLVVFLENGTAEKQLTFVGEQYIWLGKKYADSVVADVSALDSDTYKRCKPIAEKYYISLN